MFAEVTNAFMGQFAFALMALLTAAAAAFAIFFGFKARKVSVEPDPIRIEHTEPCARQSDLTHHIESTHAALNQIRAELTQDRRNNEIHASARSQSLFEKVDKVRLELDEKIENTRQELGEKIEDMPDRMITMLRNTGAI